MDVERKNAALFCLMLQSVTCCELDEDWICSKPPFWSFDWDRVAIQNGYHRFLRNNSHFLNESRKTIRLTQKKWKYLQYDRDHFQSPAFFGKKNRKASSLYFCLSSKNVHFLFPNFAFNENKDFKFNSIWNKTMEAKKRKSEPLSFFLLPLCNIF